MPTGCCGPASSNPGSISLERPQRAQRAEQLGECRAAVAHQGLERARAVAVAGQPGAERGLPLMPAAARAEMTLEQGRLDPVRAPRPPGRGGDPQRELGLQRPCGRQLRPHGAGKGGELTGALVAQQQALRAQAMLDRVAGGAGLAGGADRPARARPVAPAGRGPGEGSGHRRSLPDGGFPRAL